MNLWDHFYMSATAGQWVQGALDSSYIETLREYEDVVDFLGDFHLLMRDLKLGVLDEVFFVPETVLGVGYMVRNARGRRFEIFWLGGDGEDEDERGERQIVTEDKVLGAKVELVAYVTMSTKSKSRSVAFITGMSDAAFCGLSEMPNEVTLTSCDSTRFSKTAAFFTMSS